MEQRSLLYSYVARGSVILTDHQNHSYTGNFSDVARKCLRKLPSSYNKIYYNCSGHTFNFLTDDSGFTYCVVAVESVGVEVPFAFLERIQESFIKNCSEGKAEDAAGKSLNGKFRAKLRRQMTYCVNHQEEIRNLFDVKDVKSENIKEILDKEENIELLVYPHCPLWYENMTATQKTMVLGIMFSMIPVFVVATCPGFNCGC